METFCVGITLIIYLTLADISGSPLGGKCTTSADCVAPNVCSKWGWCQWTKIYGEDGPSQGSSAVGGGRAGQCRTSADCASRVPYCSKLGFCHGGRLPFDEAQLEIPNGEEERQGYINNDPAVNSPIFQGSTNRNNDNGFLQKQPVSKKSMPVQSECPGSTLEICIEESCVPLKSLDAYTICVEVCGRRCR